MTIVCKICEFNIDEIDYWSYSPEINYSMKKQVLENI